MTDGPADDMQRDIDELIDLIYLYDQELAKDKEYIEANATDGQAMNAFVAILGLAFGPFVRDFPRKLSNALGTDVAGIIKKLKIEESLSDTK